MNRIIFLLCLMLVSFGTAVFGQEHGTIVEIPKSVHAIIEKGLQYLQYKQTLKGSLYAVCTHCKSEKKFIDCCYGSWKSNIGYKLNHGYRRTKKFHAHVGVTSLACLAFLANGNTPNRGKYAKHLKAGLHYVLNHTDDIGFRSDGSVTAFVTHNGTRMYSHAFATLFLAEVYGMTYDEKLRVKLQKAVNLIEDCQNEKGGWRYQPYAQDADMSITVCQVQALRAARNVGIKVSKETISKALGYVQKVANKRRYMFQYQDLNHSRTSFALTAAGCTALHGVGYYNSRTIRPFLDRLKFMQNPQEGKDSYFYYYGHYYAAQAMFIEGGAYWESWYKRITKEFKLKAKDYLIQVEGVDYTLKYWPSTFVGNIYSTSMALVILQLPYKYLPILER